MSGCGEVVERDGPALPLRAIAALILIAGLAATANAAVPALALGPFVQVIDTNERDVHVDISVQFA